MKKSKKMRIIACLIFVISLVVYTYLLSLINNSFISNHSFGLAIILSLLTGEFILHFWGYGWDGRQLKDENSDKDQ